MFKKIFKSCLVLFATVAASNSFAQVDPHFSQYYVYPQWLNPGLTGVMDGDYRVAGIYRSQWASIDNGFATIGVAAEYATDKDINFGVGLFQQSAGTGGYKYFTPYASVAYTGIKFGRAGDKHLSIGINAGMIDRRFDPSKMKYGNQFNSGSGQYDPNIQSGEFLNNSSTAFDMSAGLLFFDAAPNKKANLFLGYGAGHLTQPKDMFTKTSTGATKVEIRHTIHGGVKMNLSETVSLTPNALYLKQGTASEFMLGAYTQIKAGEGFDFLVGANYRFKDAIVPFTGFYYKDFTVGLSYDVTSSDLSKIAGNANANAFELSVSFTGRKRGKAVNVPFICPRL